MIKLKAIFVAWKYTNNEAIFYNKALIGIIIATYRFIVWGWGGCCCQQPPPRLFGILPPAAIGVGSIGEGLHIEADSCPEVLLPFSLRPWILKEQLLSSDEDEQDDIVYWGCWGCFWPLCNLVTEIFMKNVNTILQRPQTTILTTYQ